MMQPIHLARNTIMGELQYRLRIECLKQHTRAAKIHTLHELPEVGLVFQERLRFTDYANDRCCQWETGRQSRPLKQVQSKVGTVQHHLKHRFLRQLPIALGDAMGYVTIPPQASDAVIIAITCDAIAKEVRSHALR